MKTTVIGTKKSGNGNSVGTYVILVLTLGAMTFFGVCSPQGRYGGGIKGTAGQVGSETISNSDFARAYEQQSQQMKSQFGEAYDPRTLKLADRVLDGLLNQRILYIKAQGLGLTASEHEIMKSLTSQVNFNDKEGKFSEENFKRFLRNMNMTELSLQEELRRGITMQKLQQMVTASVFVSSKEASLDWRVQESKVNLDFIKIDPSTIPVVISPEEREAFFKIETAKDKIKAWYDGHHADYHKPEEVHARHILKSYKGARNADTMAMKRSKDEARKEAERVLALVQAHTAGAAGFSDIAKKESDEPQGKTSGGNLGFFAREGMVKEFSDAAFALAPGQVSGVVESPFGFHIVMTEEKRPAVETTLEQASPAIVDLLLSKEKAPTQAQQLADEALALAKGKDGMDAFLQKHRLRWEHSGEFSLSARSIPNLGTKPEVMEQVFALMGTTSGEKTTEADKVALIKALPAFYVVRVLEFKPANIANLSKDQLSHLRANAAFAQGYGFFADFEAKARKEFELKKTIYKNPDYLAIDNAAPAAAQEHE